MNLPTPNGIASPISSHTRLTGPGPVILGIRTAPLVNGILWHLHTGAPWRDVPAQYGPWQTVYDRFNWWRKDGTWARILTTLLDELDDAGRISRELWCIDASVIRASRAAAGARKQPAQPCALGGNKGTQLKEPEDYALGRSRGGFGTKVHLICDRHGIVLAVFVTPGQQHESTAFETVMGRVALTQRKGRCRWPKRLAGDKGYITHASASDADSDVSKP